MLIEDIYNITSREEKLGKRSYVILLIDRRRANILITHTLLRDFTYLYYNKKIIYRLNIVNVKYIKNIYLISVTFK